MPTTLESTIRQSLKEQPILLMTHVVCGYPSLQANRTMLKLMDDIGVPLVEFQFPFSEPMADGPLFCAANQQSLNQGTTVAQCFELMAYAQQHCRFKPVMMGYYNTILQYGLESFCAKLQQCGGTAMIVPDLPPEESEPLRQHAAQHGLVLVDLLTPTTPPARIQHITNHAQGFVYCVARRGVTGAQTQFNAEVSGFLQRVRLATTLPIAVGFGVSSPEDIRFLHAHADIAIIGTAFLKCWQEQGESAAHHLLEQLQQSCRKPQG